MTSARLDAIVTSMSATMLAQRLEPAMATEDALLEELSGLARAYADSQDFVSLLAHELRTELRVIERSLQSEQGAGPARESTRSVLGLVEGLLELARGGSGGWGDGDRAMQAVVSDLGAAADTVEFRVDPLPVVRLPQILLETILRNLVANAIEAGATTIDVYARADGAMCVRDNGPGVPPAKAAVIFDSYSGRVGGAGLGLKLCREILRRRGGEIWLELPSTFCFRVG
jgi:signal transduction histidine kinase